MDELERFFRNAIGTQAEAVSAALEGVSSGDSDASVELRRLAHSLRGSGATYGFPEISEAAAAVESADPDELIAATKRLLEVMETVRSQPERHTVLVVDDDPLITRLLEVKLSSPHRRVVTAQTLADARRLTDDAKPDAVLLDLFLPDGDGRTFLAELKSTTDAPVFVISGGPADADEQPILGADAYLGKPFDPEAVAALVSQALSVPRTDRRGEAYRHLQRLHADGRAAAVASILAESHGPGGMHVRVGDPRLTSTIAGVLTDLLSPAMSVTEWSSGELVLVGEEGLDKTHTAVERCRLRLRNVPHPTTEGAILSFSGGIVESEPDETIADAYGHARRLAVAASDQGGDRVVIHQQAEASRRVLLAEDDTLTAALVIHRLERENYEVIHCVDGLSAVEVANGSEFGLVVLDVEMPGLDGFGVLERLRSDHSFAETPIVMLTAVGGERDVVRGFDLGADDYILKPFSPAELTARLKRFTRP